MSFLFWLLLGALVAREDYALAQEITLEEIFGSSLGAITDIQQPPGIDDDRLSVVDKAGFIRILNTADASVTTFLDISSQVKNAGERGLLGLAFHPNYETNGYFYVNYIYDDSSQGEASCNSGVGGNTKDTRISRFQRSSTNDNIADVNSELVIAEIPQPYCNHNGGQLQFGSSDGYLYIATGDGGSGNDPLNKAVDLTSLLGKILRVDINNMDESIAAVLPRWNIPPDNPFVDTPAARKEIWLYGLRNPWRFSFDGDNNMWIADVGQNAREEVNFIESSSTAAGGGGHYGWRHCEGTRENIDLPDRCSCSNNACFIPPVFEYGREVGSSVTGGYVYQGKEPSLVGIYFYADYVSATLWGARIDEDTGIWNNVIEDSVPSASTFGIDNNGEVYVGTIGGRVYRIMAPTEAPSKAPTEAPSTAPTEAPSKAPTEAPAAPTEVPSKAPSEVPSKAPTEAPTESCSTDEKCADNFLLLLLQLFLGWLGFCFCEL